MFCNYFFKQMFKPTFDQVLLILFVVIPIIMGWFIFAGYVKIYDKCEEAQNIHNLYFNGIVVEKKDANQFSRSQYLVIQSNPNKDDFLFLGHDQNFNKETGNSTIWELINIGDSTVKESGSFKVKYKKSNQNWKSKQLGFKLCK